MSLPASINKNSAKTASLGFSNGFSAIELLITLFVASLFLFSGYQLYSVVLENSGNTKSEAIVANRAYSILREYSSRAKNPCVASTLELYPYEPQVNIDSSTVLTTCPQSATTSLSKIEVSITYNNGTKTVKQATYIDMSGK